MRKSWAQGRKLAGMQGGDASEGSNSSATWRFWVEKEEGQSWGNACGGPLEISISLPAGVTSDASGHVNGFSNTL